MNAFADEQTVWAYAIPDRQWIPMPDRQLLIGLRCLRGIPLKAPVLRVIWCVRVSHMYWTGVLSDIKSVGCNFQVSCEMVEGRSS
jgi:hypothetical protein